MKAHRILQRIRQSPFASSTAFVCYGAALLLALLNANFITGTLTNLYEDAAWDLSPSAERAFAYGERHFNGQDKAAYDVDRAEYFFREAVKLDPSLVYVHHELARIHFLRGHFWDAMAQINTQIEEHGDDTPNSYYVRGLIEGYMGNYADSARDYEHFLKFDPRNWAGINDYAWVLLKAGRAKDAKVATDEGLKYFPDNPWLLNSSAIALYEMGKLKEADVQVKKAWTAVQKVKEPEWLRSYPGNDPAIAGQGIATFRKSVQENMHSIALAIASSTVQ